MSVTKQGEIMWSTNEGSKFVKRAVENRAKIMHEYFVALGKKGGAARSPAKTAAARNANKMRWKNHAETKTQ